MNIKSSIVLLMTIVITVYGSGHSGGQMENNNPNGPVTKGCNCIAFRVDDIQDNWITAAQTQLMKVFQDQDLPLTIGIIANYFGKDSNIVQPVKDAIDSDWDLEIANHGWNHEFFSTFTLEQQIELLTNGTRKTLSVLEGHIDNITTFIAPFNDFNADTLTALGRTGYRIISSETSMDSYPNPTALDSPLFHWPIGSASCNLSLPVDLVGVTADVMFADIQKQMSTYGFAAVMLHPQEFCILDSDNQPTEAVDPKMFAQLAAVIAMAQNAGYNFVTLGEIADAFNGIQVGSNGKAVNGTKTSGSTTGDSGNSNVPSTSGAAQQPMMTTGVPMMTTGVPMMTTGVPVATTGQSVAGLTSASSTSCTAGSKGCACNGGKACDNGLTCTFGVCAVQTQYGNSASSLSAMIILSVIAFVMAF